MTAAPPGRPLRVVNSAAPVRVCDNGGWTDTWFAGYGCVFNIAVYPYAEVQIRVFEQAEETPRVTILAENYGQRYTIEKPRGSYDKNPLLEAAIEHMKIPSHTALEVSIFSEAPVGCSTGTSAAVSVALIGCLDLLTPGRMTPHGQKQVDAAKADGRWGKAYAPIRSASHDSIPADLRKAIEANARAKKTFATLGRVNLFALLPVHLVMKGQKQLSLRDTAPEGAGLGDFALGARIRLLGDVNSTAALSGEVIARLPTAELANNDQHYSGDAVGSYEPALIGEVRSGPFDVRLRAGARLRKSAKIGNLNLDQELVYGLGARMRVSEPFSLHVEVYGTTFFKDAFARTYTPLELLAGGKLVHAEEPAKSAAARELLHQSAVALRRAKGRLRLDAPDRALAEWKGLVAARWTLVDHFESDGQRYVLARRNDVPVRGFGALTERERQVVSYAALGHSSKLIAYELGIADFDSCALVHEQTHVTSFVGFERIPHAA